MLNCNQKFSYYAYGLNIDSFMELSELIPREGEAAVKISLGKLDNLKVDRNQDYTLVATPSSFCKNWRNIGTFLVQDGCKVIIDPAPNVQISSLSPYITGPIMACILHQRGIMVLHSSAVVVNDNAVGFLAESGVGKSTLAAFLQQRGGRLITDDVLPVVFTDQNIQVVSGYPQLRLWGDSLSVLGVDSQQLPKVNQYVDKRFYRIPQDFSAQLFNLKALYIISENKIFDITTFDLTSAFIEIVRHSYMRHYIDSTEKTLEHFQNCKKLIQATPVFNLQRPKSYEVLPKVAALLENHISNL